MTTGAIPIMAEFERDLLVERPQASLARTEAEGKAIGHPSALSGAQQEAMRARRAAVVFLRALTKDYGVSSAAIQRAERRG